MGAIPIKPSPKSTRRAIETAREALASRRAGVHLSRRAASAAPASCRRSSRACWKSSAAPARRSFPSISTSCGAASSASAAASSSGNGRRRSRAAFRSGSASRSHEPTDIHEVRQAVQDLGADAVAGRKQRTAALPRAMIRNCRKAMFRWKIADSTGAELTGGKLLAATLVLRRLLLRHVLDAGREIRRPAAAAVGRQRGRQRRPVAGRPRHRESELHGVAGRAQRVHPPGRHPPRPHQPQGDGEPGRWRSSKTRSTPSSSTSKTCASKVTRGDKLVGALGAYVAPGIHARPHARPAPHPRRRRGDGHLHLRLDRHAQGRDAHAPQHRHQRRGDRPGRPPAAERLAARHRAVLPFARLHGHAVGAAAARHPRRLPLLAARVRGSSPSWPGTRGARSCWPRRRSCAATCGAASRRSWSRWRSSSPAPKSCPSRCATRSSRSSASGRSKATARPSSRRWCRSTCRPAARRVVERRLQGRLRRPARAGRLGEDRRPRNVRRRCRSARPACCW